MLRAENVPRQIFLEMTRDHRLYFKELLVEKHRHDMHSCLHRTTWLAQSQSLGLLICKMAAAAVPPHLYWQLMPRLQENRHICGVFLVTRNVHLG